MKSSLLVLIVSALFSLSAFAIEQTDAFPASDVLVKLTPAKSYVDVSHKGRTIRIMRNQNPENLLEKPYTKTSRPCPPFCIQPIEMAPEIENVGELELIEFLEQEVAQGQGLLVDVRMPRFYDLETIPGAINIPFILLNSNIKEVLPMLGVSRSLDEWSYQNAKSLLVFCNGPWCSQSGRAIEALLSVNYPIEKILYYRGGMQVWKLMGLSTISQQAFTSVQSQNEYR